MENQVLSDKIDKLYERNSADYFAFFSSIMNSPKSSRYNIIDIMAIYVNFKISELEAKFDTRLQQKENNPFPFRPAEFKLLKGA